MIFSALEVRKGSCMVGLSADKRVRVVPSLFFLFSRHPSDIMISELALISKEYDDNAYYWSTSIRPQIIPILIERVNSLEMPK